MVVEEEEDVALAGDKELAVAMVERGNAPEGDKVLGLDHPRFE